MRLVALFALLISGCAWFDEQERISDCVAVCERGICSPALTNNAASPTRRADCEACIGLCDHGSLP